MKESLLFGRLMTAPEPAARKHPGSFALNLQEEVEHLQESASWSRGANRITLTRHADFRVDLFAIRAASTIARHSNPGRVVIQCVEGWIRLNSAAGAFDLSSGEILVLEPNVWHDLEARVDSAFLVTISTPQQGVVARIDGARTLFPPLQSEVPPPPSVARSTFEHEDIAVTMARSTALRCDSMEPKVISVAEIAHA